VSHISAAIGSVLRQTFKDFELIVWDDGSTDDAAAVAERTANGHPRVRVVRVPRQGVAASLNAAARGTNGRYLGRVDSEDALAPTALERTVAALESQPNAGKRVHAALRDERGGARARTRPAMHRCRLRKRASASIS
jgi:glycosyltransferase involved in cell wall biosynthesis